jgi:type II secretory pathway component PulF
MSLDILYCVSLALTWVVVPANVSFLRYNHSLSLKTRIWLVIRENLLFDGIVLLIVVIGIIIVFATIRKDTRTGRDVDDGQALAIPLANGYGLLIFASVSVMDLYRFIVNSGKWRRPRIDISSICMCEGVRPN